MFIKRLYFWGLLVLCFLFGAVSATVYETMATKETRRSRRVRTSEVVKQIDMTDAQRSELNKVLEDGRKRMIDLNRSMRSEWSKIRKETRAQIREMLTDEQRATFDRLIAQAKSHRSQTAREDAQNTSKK